MSGSPITEPTSQFVSPLFNSGYVIENASGMPYADFVQTNIFTPLGMKDSGYDLNASIIERRAAGYARRGEAMVNADFVHMSIPHAAGGLYSTTEDLLRWQRGLYGGKLLSAASLTKMTTSFKGDYALGLAVHTGKRKLYSHGGGIEGFNTQLAYYPETQVTVVALANLNGGAPADIVAKLGALMHGESIMSGPISCGPDSTWSSGSKARSSSCIRPGKAPIASILKPQTRSSARSVDATIQFHRNPQGQITHLTLNQGQFKGDARRK